jgi:hypothetical protein
MRRRQPVPGAAAVAHFLIFMLVESTTTALIDVDPRLGAITADLERIEREHGLEEGEYWHANEVPPEWQALNREWEAAAEAIMVEKGLGARG